LLLLLTRTMTYLGHYLTPFFRTGKTGQKK
jgi:hypothetical protein